MTDDDVTCDGWLVLLLSFNFNHVSVVVNCLIIPSILQLYRDCLRLVRHIAPGHSAKAMALRQTVRSQFEASRHETNEAKIEALKANAVRALSNYLLYQSSQKDEQLKQAIKRKDGQGTMKPPATQEVNNNDEAKNEK